MTSRHFVLRAFVFVSALLTIGLLPTSATLAAPDMAAESNNYRLASGDLIRITVFQNPDLTLETRVSEDGTINYPLVGPISIGNMDLGVAEKRIEKALADGGFLRKPQLSIQLLDVRGNKVAVLGQVNKPGSFGLVSMNTRLSQVLADAGGLMPTGDDRIILTGTRNGKPFRQEIDVDSLYRDQHPENDILLAGGDSIYVPRAPSFYIYGEVTKPGNYRIEKNMTMRQALAAAGGLSLRGTDRRLKVVHAAGKGAGERTGTELNELVAPGDTIYVAESIF